MLPHEGSSGFGPSSRREINAAEGHRLKLRDFALLSGAFDCFSYRGGYSEELTGSGGWYLVGYAASGNEAERSNQAC